MVLSRISEEITKVEQTRVVNETMMASSVVTVHTAPDQSQADEGFYEPKQSQPNEKETYEASSPFLSFIYRIFLSGGILYMLSLFSRVIWLLRDYYCNI